MLTSDEEPLRAVLVAVQLPHVAADEHEANLRELERLVKTLGLKVVGRVTQRRGRLRAGTLLGLGKLRELAHWTGGDGEVMPEIESKKRADERRARLLKRAEAQEPDVAEESDREGDELDAADEAEGVLDAPTQGSRPKASIVVVDHALSPRLLRNLERATGAEVLDRTHVIVEIFHRHAKTREARLQVEIARLSYVAPRLREAGAGSDRQRGGIGGKGAGESAVELDRRKIRDRIAELKEELEGIEREQATRRAARRDERRVALVGYTNAGKSSLMRALTQSGVYVADQLFATLDTTVRALQPETVPRILVSDTVGFINKLPHELIASFRSTLAEAVEASLLLHVIDVSEPTYRDQLRVTREVLAEIGAGDVPSRLVLNKRDRLELGAAEALLAEFPDALLMSAHDASDVPKLRELIASFFDGELCEEELFVPYARHAHIGLVYEQATVLNERHDAEGTHFLMRAHKNVLQGLRRRFEARN